MDTSSFEIGELKDVYKNKTKYTINESIFQAITPVTFVVNVRDTLERRVVKKGKNGELTLLSLNSSQIAEVKEMFGAEQFELGVSVKIVGGPNGGVNKLEMELVFAGFTFILQMGKDGLTAYAKSPLDYQRAQEMDTYGSKNFDLFITAKVVSTRTNSTQTVKTRDGVKGRIIDRSDSTGHTVDSNQELTVKFKGTEITLDLPKPD